MSSEVLPGVDRIENENIHKINMTTTEALTGDSVPNLKELYKRELDCSSYQNGTSTRMEAVDDRAGIKSTMDCIEENVSLPAQQKTSQDIILHKKLEEIECASYQMFTMDESLLSGSELEAPLLQPSSHDVPVCERKIYDLMLQSHESTLSNEKWEQQSHAKSQTVTVAISKPDGKYQTCMQGLDRSGRLNHVLDLIISLDKQENFLDPVDDSIAPNYSKVINVPMCFKTMRGKVLSQQYSNWQAFVDDFERICYNAMKYNQVRSSIWRAAKKLLHQGKWLLEKFEKRDAKVIDSTKQLADACSLGHFSNNFGTDNLINLNRGKEGLTSSCALMSQCSQTSIPPGQVTLMNSLELKVMGEIVREEEEALVEDDCLTPAEALSNLVQGACPDHHNHLTNARARKRKSRLYSNINVVEAEISDYASLDSVRVDSDSQATETSSSFGCSLDEGENDHVLTKLWDSPEVQSNLRNDSGGIVSPQDEASVYEVKERKKNALNQEWKAYRRGIEWRCHWLELRVKALQDQASRYDLFLEGREAKKPWRTKQGWHISSAARTLSFTEKHTKQPVLHRNRRRKVEDTTDATSFMSRHPLFSRYEKKRQGLDNLHEGRVDKQHFGLIEHPSMHLEDTVQPEESDMDEPPPLLKGAIFGEDSNEELLWNIESLQIRVVQLRNQLNRRALLNSNEAHLKSACQGLEAKNVFPVIRTQFPLSSPKGILRPSRHRLDTGLSLIGQKASGLAAARRRAADYDICNIVMSTSVIAKYVEPVRPTKIETPRWKRLDKFFSPAHWNEDSSSDEGTDDELYKKMHDRMVAKERLHQVSHSSKRSIPEVGTSPIYTVLQARGKIISMDPMELERKCEDHDYLTVENKSGYCEPFPKGKRTRRDSRCNFTHSRGRKLLNLFADTSIHGFNGDLEIKNDNLGLVPES